MFADMRLRQQQLREAERGAPRESQTAYRIRERRKAQGGLPPHLEFFRVKEVAEALHVHPTTVSRWFRARAVKAGESAAGPRRRKRTLLISRKMLEDWVRERSA
jgi:hypothetical protein